MELSPYSRELTSSGAFEMHEHRNLAAVFEFLCTEESMDIILKNACQ